jgi:hypothetical protein
LIYVFKNKETERRVPQQSTRKLTILISVFLVILLRKELPELPPHLIPCIPKPLNTKLY